MRDGRWLVILILLGALLFLVLTYYWFFFRTELTPPIGDDPQLRSKAVIDALARTEN